MKARFFSLCSSFAVFVFCDPDGNVVDRSR